MVIDVNVNYGIWPFRRFEINTVKKIEEKLKKNGIDYAFISHLGCVFNFQEVEEYNKELIEKIKNHRRLNLLPVINPKVCDIEEIENLKAIKIIPGYHFYSLNDRNFNTLFKKINDKKILLFIQMRYEDERSHHPLFKVKPPALEEIKQFALNFPEIRIILLCGYFNEIVQLCKIENIYSDISFVEHYKTIKSLLCKIPADKILFGSHTPFLYLESQIAKIKYAEVKEEEIEKISFKNFSLLWGGIPSFLLKTGWRS
jgi:predicted TIM-barrel fold metal-dependent hydrolase